jgi:hypothetical protein
MKKIDSIQEISLDLDTYSNINYIIDNIQNLNISTLVKNNIILNNLNTTLTDNFSYIINIINYFLDPLHNTFFKMYNLYEFNRSTNNVLITLNPNTANNYYSNIFINLDTNINNFNEYNNYYNSLQNIIKKSIDNYINNYLEVNYTQIIRYIYNLKNISDSQGITQDTNLLTILYNIQYKLDKFIHIINDNIILSNISVKIDNKYYSKIYFTLPLDNSFNSFNSFNDISRIKSSFNDSSRNYYLINNVICSNDISSNTDLNLNITPTNAQSNKDLYYLIYLISQNIGLNIYIVPYTRQINNSSDLSGYLIEGTRETIYDYLPDDINDDFNINNYLNNLNNQTNYQINNFYITNFLNNNIDIGYILYHYIYK